MKTDWYLTRASGAVALILLTISVVVGIAEIGRLRTRRWPRFAVDEVHRFSSLLALVFLVIHILTAVLDGFAPISLGDAVIPFTGAYRPVWLGLGAAAFDLLLAVAITSALRLRLGYRTWRAVHWLAYAAWPIAIVHGLGTGSDVRRGWMAVIYLTCGAATVAAVLARLAFDRRGQTRLRLAGLGATAGFIVGIALWLPAGPLGPRWSQRAGTPANLLPPVRRQTGGS